MNWLLSCYKKDKIQGTPCAKGRWNLFLRVELIACISVAVFHQTKPQKALLVYLGGDELCSPDECWHWIQSTKMCLDLQDRDYLAFARDTCCLPSCHIQNRQEWMFLLVYAVGFSISIARYLSPHCLRGT